MLFSSNGYESVSQANPTISLQRILNRKKFTSIMLGKDAPSVKVVESRSIIMASVKFSWLNQVLFALVLLPLFLPRTGRNVNGIGGGLMMVVSGDDEAEKKLLAIFIADIKKLLTHNQDFYNNYGYKDTDVDLAFEEAKFAAEIISLNPEIFRYRVQQINVKITEALNRKKMMDEDDAAASSAATAVGLLGVTADGVPALFVDNCLILLNTVGRIVRFPEW